jgi:hypothetical protein
MKLSIFYESSWRNSFLDGSNNEPLPKDGRKFVGSMTELKKEGNFIQRPITHDTVMGVLNRLIGDQRKLYQARESTDYYFKAMERDQKITFNDRQSRLIANNEIVYIRNVSGSTDQNTFTGLIKANDPAFNSAYSSQLWSVLYLGFNDLVTFILLITSQHMIRLVRLISWSLWANLKRLNRMKTLRKSSHYFNSTLES